MALIETFTLVDRFAFLWFLFTWIGYSYIADHPKLRAGGLVGLTHTYRLQWVKQMLKRENRMVDSNLLGNLMSSVSFFASTTIYIIAGLIAIMGTVKEAISFTSELPFVKETSREVWEIKLLLLLAVFVYAYFKFTWSLRQFNLLSILMGGSPISTGNSANEAYIHKAAKIHSLAGDEFNRGIRAYYFGLAALTWFLQPWFFIGVTTFVTFILIRRDYASETLRVLRIAPPQSE